ncbi:MAG: hypothetical protein EPO13_02275 [Actinomycetota bacterium]|nr:MAG: hypothetical protein EPO13_02275 [Actinomycetota bacterium]
MGRRNRRQPESGGAGPLAWSAPVTEEGPDGSWVVRPVSGAAAAKVYRCPGCDHEIAVGVPHVVAWPADRPDGAQLRRHWHTPCWSARHRRRPR